MVSKGGRVNGMVFLLRRRSVRLDSLSGSCDSRLTLGFLARVPRRRAPPGNADGQSHLGRSREAARVVRAQSVFACACRHSPFVGALGWGRALS